MRIFLNLLTAFGQGCALAVVFQDFRVDLIVGLQIFSNDLNNGNSSNVMKLTWSRPSVPFLFPSLGNNTA